MEGGKFGGTGVRTPVDAILAMAREEVGDAVSRCMGANRIPPGLMAHVLREVLLDLTQMQVSQLAGEIARLQREAMEGGGGDADAEG